jgi:hypothetical protein
MTSNIPVDILERRAAEQRRQLHNSVVELRQTVKDRLDVKRNVREYLGPAAGVSALAGLILGYIITGIFTRH